MMKMTTTGWVISMEVLEKGTKREGSILSLTLLLENIPFHLLSLLLFLIDERVGVHEE